MRKVLHTYAFYVASFFSEAPIKFNSGYNIFYKLIAEQLFYLWIHYVTLCPTESLDHLQAKANYTLVLIIVSSHKCPLTFGGL